MIDSDTSNEEGSSRRRVVHRTQGSGGHTGQEVAGGAGGGDLCRFSSSSPQFVPLILSQVRKNSFINETSAALQTICWRM